MTSPPIELTDSSGKRPATLQAVVVQTAQIKAVGLFLRSLGLTVEKQTGEDGAAFLTAKCPFLLMKIAPAEMVMQQIGNRSVLRHTQSTNNVYLRLALGVVSALAIVVIAPRMITVATIAGGVIALAFVRFHFVLVVRVINASARH